MQESAQIALSWIKSNHKHFPFEDFQFENVDFHLHVPSGGVPKEGPSAGITILMSLLSHLLNRPIAQGLGMTGEISLLGEILPVGGIRDKVLAAVSMNLTSLILPKGNQKDFDLLTQVKDLSVTFVDDIFSAIKIAFGSASILDILSKL